MIRDDVQKCKNCELCNLDINKIKPFDKDRVNKKIPDFGGKVWERNIMHC